MQDEHNRQVVGTTVVGPPATPAAGTPSGQTSTASPTFPPGAAPLPPPPVTDRRVETGPRFERVRLHGAGGIGQVWLAHDRLLNRDVALKELLPERADDEDLARRFLDEARVTARLEHPGIVPVYDLPSLALGGPPCYAMRFVQGRTLTGAIAAYHEQRRRGAPRALDRTALLNAFVAVCNAVAFAHARGVVHRDLKGQNVVLGDFGEVIVLDWGLAKQFGHVESNAALAAADRADPRHTLPGQILGTPAYMAPEQAAGQIERIDARTDVYSLGAMLYEILTGRPPFTFEANSGSERPEQDATILELLRRIREDAPPRPRQLVAEVPAALEAVCLKALTKDPAGRYQSAADLGREVQRWLADEPVEAHGEPWPARLGRWARRNKAKVAALTAFLIAAVAGLAVTTVLTARERVHTDEARARAEHNFRKAQEAVDRYLTQVSEHRLLNVAGQQPLRKELLGIAREFYEGFARERGDDPESRNSLGQALLKLGRVSGELGERERAVKLLGEARELFARLAREHPHTLAYRHGLAESHLALGYQSFRLRGATAAMETDFRTARALWDELVREPGGDKYRGDLANAHNSLAVYYLNAARAAEPAQRQALLQQAETTHEEGLSLCRQLVEAEPDVPGRLNDLAAAFNNLANVYRSTDRPEKARSALERSLELRKRLAEKHGKVLEYQVNLASSYNNFGNHLQGQGQFERAEQALRQAIAVDERLARKNPFVIEFQNKLAMAEFNLGGLYYEVVGRSTGAVRARSLSRGKEAYEKALAIYRRLAEEYPEETRFEVGRAQTLTCLGNLAFEEDLAAALPWYDQAIAALEPLLARGQKDADLRRALAGACWGRAEAHARAGRLAQSVANWDRALELYAGSQRDTLEGKRAQTRLRLAAELAAAGHYEKAATEAARLAPARLTAGQQAEAARVLALCTRTAASTNSPQTNALAGQAVAWLQRAAKAGSFRQQAQAPVLALCRSIQAIAGREDFQRLLREVAGKL